jgi:hypothetical protein
MRWYLAPVIGIGIEAVQVVEPFHAVPASEDVELTFHDR